VASGVVARYWRDVEQCREIGCARRTLISATTDRGERIKISAEEVLAGESPEAGGSARAQKAGAGRTVRGVVCSTSQTDPTLAGAQFPGVENPRAILERSLMGTPLHATSAGCWARIGWEGRHLVC